MCIEEEKRRLLFASCALWKLEIHTRSLDSGFPQSPLDFHSHLWISTFHSEITQPPPAGTSNRILLSLGREYAANILADQLRQRKEAKFGHDITTSEVEKVTGLMGMFSNVEKVLTVTTIAKLQDSE